MPTFPSVKTVEADGVADEPNSPTPQIHILAANHAYIFDTIPRIIIGRADRHHRFRRGHIHRGGRD
jgi:hypothetical protein